jgi:long-chain fatty acid transport protein
MNLPMSIGYGMAYDVYDNFRLSFDFEWVNWANAFDKMEIKLTNGSNDNVNTMIGSKDFNIDFPLKWKDAVIIKIGGEYDITNHFTMRIGFAYGSNPVPETTVFPVFPAIVEHHLTIGATYSINDDIKINGAFETALNKKLSAANPSEIQSEFSGSISQLSTTIGHLGLTWNF